MIIVALVSALSAYTIGVGVGESRERERIIKVAEEEAGIYDPANYWTNSGNVNDGGNHFIYVKLHCAEHGEPPKSDALN
ncbi:hypothetical protein [Weissella oryzae]|nr:hypothetical protein [Weissella oryzae]